MGHVAHVNASCRTCEWVMSHMLQVSVAVTSCNLWMRHVAHVMSHTSMRRVVHMNASYCTREWVLLHLWMSHVALVASISDSTPRRVTYAWVRELCRACEWGVSHILMRHVAHMNESCRTCCRYQLQRTTSCDVWMSHVAHMNESCRIYEWVTSHIWTSHVAHVAGIGGSARPRASRSAAPTLDYFPSCLRYRS